MPIPGHGVFYCAALRVSTGQKAQDAPVGGPFRPPPPARHNAPMRRHLIALTLAASFADPLSLAEGQSLDCAGYRLDGLGGGKARLSAVVDGRVDPVEKSEELALLPSGAPDFIYLARDKRYAGIPIVSRIEAVLFKRERPGVAVKGILRFSELYLDEQEQVAGGAVNASLSLECRIEGEPAEDPERPVLPL